jgi:hypothetical protein
MSDQGQPNVTTLPCTTGVAALRNVVHAYVGNGHQALPDETWRVPARVMCEDARAHGLQIEELIISLKRAWPGVTHSQRLSRDESSRLLARFVTLCVKEYYGRIG